MKLQIKAFILLFTFPVLADNINETPEYLNTDLSVETRVNDLISRMTLEEKVSQMTYSAGVIDRLHIPEYNWWNECLHGVARAGIATVFPQAIGLAATWDTNLMFETADVISTEARAKHHEAIKNKIRRQYLGLTFWSPNINIFRDPRWGRGQETYGEDPYLTSRMGVAFVKGLQGDDPHYFKVIATPKHYAVHSGPEPDRHHFDAITNERDLYDTYLPAFKSCVMEAGAYSVMCAYNRYNGEACCSSPALLKDILRNDWNFQGYIVSDCGAIRDIYEHHKITETGPEAAALAVKSGTDLNCGGVYASSLVKAVELGLITEQEIDISVKRLFTARFRLGMFDPPELVPYASTPFEKNDCETHRQLSVRTARESMVLLKNRNLILPLSKDLRKIAVIGPTADSYSMLLGNYNGFPSKHVTPLQGIRAKVSPQTEIVYEQGCNLVKKGAITHPLSLNMVTLADQPDVAGLKAEYFKNPDLEGEPFYSRIDSLGSENWLWSARIPGIRRGMKISIRWSGLLQVPESGNYNFTVKGSDGYRLFIGDSVLVEDWTEHEVTEKFSQIYLNEDTTYTFELEYFYSKGWPQLSLQWELLDFDPFRKAVQLAEESDAVIFVGGITSELEGEEMRVNYEGFHGGDRTSIALPKVQQDLLMALHETGKPVVLVLSSGSALAVNWADDHLPAIIQMWYPGQEGGTALADIIFGDYNPAGRLPVTYYRSVDQLPPFEDYRMFGRTYRYFDGKALYPFGYGLSYTRFRYLDLDMPDSSLSGTPIKITTQVKNTGSLAGDEVVQIYVKDVKASVPVPLQSLQGFKRIHLNPGETRTVEFILTPEQLALYTDDGEHMVEPGLFEIAVGGGVPGGIPETSGGLFKKIRVIGDPYPIK